jgi:hypothetical protein
MVCERVLMHTISFDLSVEHPYTYLVKLLKMVQGSSPKSDGFRPLINCSLYPGIEKSATRELLQDAWILTNDRLASFVPKWTFATPFSHRMFFSFYTDLCLQYNPWEVACAAVYASVRCRDKQRGREPQTLTDEGWAQQVKVDVRRLIGTSPKND